MTIPEKQRKIITLLSDGAFHSDTDLASTLGLSQSVVCEHLHGLAELGLPTLAVNGKGYRLEKPIEFLSTDKIVAFLETSTRAHLPGIEIHDQIDSTNRYLAEHAVVAPLRSGFVCLAEQQTAGKGRRGRCWVSPFGRNIYLSLLWRFANGFADTAGLSLVVGVAVVRVLRALGLADVGLKWPNDIYCHGKKLGGILIEAAGAADGSCHTVIGLGLNVYLPQQQAGDIQQDWTDLSRIQGTPFTGRNRLVAKLLDQMVALLRDFETRGLAGFLDEWRGYDCLQGQNARLFINERHLDGVVLGIDGHGLLLFARDNGTVQAFASGEVSFHTPAP